MARTKIKEKISNKNNPKRFFAFAAINCPNKDSNEIKI